jgi:hypothetical protein
VRSLYALAVTCVIRPFDYDVQHAERDDGPRYYTAAEYHCPESEGDNSSIFSHEGLLARLSEEILKINNGFTGGRTYLQPPMPRLDGQRKLPMLDGLSSDREGIDLSSIRPCAPWC